MRGTSRWRAPLSPRVSRRRDRLLLDGFRLGEGPYHVLYESRAEGFGNSKLRWRWTIHAHQDTGDLTSMLGRNRPSNEPLLRLRNCAIASSNGAPQILPGLGYLL